MPIGLSLIFLLDFPAPTEANIWLSYFLNKFFRLPASADSGRDVRCVCQFVACGLSPWSGLSRPFSLLTRVVGWRKCVRLDVLLDMLANVWFGVRHWRDVRRGLVGLDWLLAWRKIRRADFDFFVMSCLGHFFGGLWSRVLCGSEIGSSFAGRKIVAECSPCAVDEHDVAQMCWLVCRDRQEFCVAGVVRSADVRRCDGRG